MATVDEYLSQADHNAQVAALLSDAPNGRAPRSLQWAVVCAFYSGVHYVNAYLKRTHLGLPDNHGERQQKINELLPRGGRHPRALQDARVDDFVGVLAAGGDGRATGNPTVLIGCDV